MHNAKFGRFAAGSSFVGASRTASIRAMNLSEDQADTVVLGDWLALRRLGLHSSFEPSCRNGVYGLKGFEGV